MRVGIITSGSGLCVTPEGDTSLKEGLVWIIHEDGKHKFQTKDEGMIVIAYHPESDFGPEDELHPMKKQSENSATLKSQQGTKIGTDKQPINFVQWIHRDNLIPNLYNPNKVAPPELELLKISIIEDGWTQPIVINPDLTIVDGFHRHQVSLQPEVFEMTKGFVPCVMVELDKSHKMMSTIRHNRARGTHGVVPMAEIVRTMFEKDNLSKQEIMDRLKMEDEEVDRLLVRAGLPAQQGNGTFKKSFTPDA